MWTGLLLLGAIGVLLAWLLLNHTVFAVLASAAAFLVFMLAVAWDGWRQTSPSNLASRGLLPGDRSLRVMDTGLRREYAPMVPSVVRRGVSTTRNRLRSAPPAPRSRPPAAPAAPMKKAARSRRTRQRSETLQP